METTETKSETVSINGVEHNVADLSPQQLTLVQHVSDLDGKARQINFNLEQTLGARNHFMGLLTQSFEEPVESDSE
jgi:hypothetical protein|tara:strand:- start:2111 stop:2338 length:228 start_codon:yes stop_codon:yes gene_type:complete